MNTVQSLTKLEAAIAAMAGYSAEDYREIEEAASRGLERARGALVMKGRVQK